MRKKILFMLMLIMSYLYYSVEVEAKTLLKVGYVPATGFMREDRPGHFLGYGYEYMEFLTCYGNFEFEYIPCISWQDCNVKLQAGIIDVLPAMPGAYQSLQNVTRTDHVVGRYPMQLIIHGKKLPASPSRSLIGTIPSNPPIPGFAKVAAEENFTYDLINFPLFYDMEEAFNRHQLDGYISPMLEPNKKLAEDTTVLAIFDRQSYRILVRSDRKDLLAELNDAMDQMLMDQPNIRNKLNDKYLRQGGSPLILSKLEREYLTDKQKLTVAFFSNEKPYSYYEGTRIHGLIPNIISQISKDLNIQMEIVRTNSLSEAVQLINAGKVDLIADAICDFSLGDQLGITPTTPYMILEYVAVKRQGETVDENSKLACIADAPYTQTFLFPRYPEEQRVYFKNIRDCFRAVSEGSADVLYIHRAEFPFIATETECYNLEASSESYFMEELSLGIYNQADTRLWRIMSKEIGHLDVNSIVFNSVTEETNVRNMSLRSYLYYYPLRAMGIFLLIIAFIGLIIWNRLRIRRKNIEQVHQLAYTDPRYNLRNLIWFKREVPQSFDVIKKEGLHAYIVSMIIDVDKSHIEHLILQTMDQLKNVDWVVLSAVGEENGTIFCLCKARHSSELFQLVREFIRDNAHDEIDGSRLWFRIRAGIARVQSNSSHPALEHATLARDDSKDDVKIFDNSMVEKIDFERKIEERMKKSLQDSEFIAWYQPEYKIDSHNIVGAEASVRWQNEELGFLLPEKFMSIFERNGFIMSIDYFILEKVCEMERSRHKDGKKYLPVAVNHSFLHMFEEDYLDRVKAIYKKYKLPRNLITIEFKENDFESVKQHQQREKVADVIRELQTLGFQISIKEFVGNTSLHDLLGYLSIDMIKLDKKLLESVDSSTRMKDILGSIIHLCNQLKVKVICSGIEKKNQEEILLQLGCEYGQGFVEFENGEIE